MSRIKRKLILLPVLALMLAGVGFMALSQAEAVEGDLSLTGAITDGGSCTCAQNSGCKPDFMCQAIKCKANQKSCGPICIPIDAECNSASCTAAGGNWCEVTGPTCTDADSDGFFAEGGECGPVDCNDFNADVNPEATETCDGLDNDCDTTIDESITNVTASIHVTAGNGNGVGRDRNSLTMVNVWPNPATDYPNPTTGGIFPNPAGVYPNPTNGIYPNPTQGTIFPNPAGHYPNPAWGIYPNPATDYPNPTNGIYPNPANSEPLSDLTVFAFNATEGSCAHEWGADDWKNYSTIMEKCEPAGTCVTTEDGTCAIELVPDNYLTISEDSSGSYKQIGNSIGQMTCEVPASVTLLKK